MHYIPSYLLPKTDNQVYGKHYEMAPDYNETPYEIPQESLRKDGFSTLQFPPELVYEPTAGENIYASPNPLTGNGVRAIDGRFIDFLDATNYTGIQISL